MKLDKTWIVISLLIVLVVSLSGCVSNTSSYTVETTESEEDYGIMNGPPGEWNLINGTLTNGTYNTTDLGKLWDRSSRYIVHVDSPEFVFVYNDGNSSKYKGDTGLKYTLFYDDKGCCYHIEEALTRGIAYVTGGTFDVDGFNFSRRRNSNKDYYYVYSEVPDKTNVTLDNGTVVFGLYIYDNLTLEEKKYFDDYDTQLYKYYEDKKSEEMRKSAIIEEYEDQIHREHQSDSRKSGSFSGYSRRGGYIYGRYY
jgi:hypothetical protein